ncbi:MAG TPA: adenylate/guanylate cyclase domain-containing protein, partial [Rhodopila sp.]|nr:adenylate/guanylate cyclase domain-containing protein [Rhodopila sp.]
GPTAQAGKVGADALNAAPMQGTQAASTAEAERRPLSVMFCDLVGSTALSSRLDPGDLRAVIRAYQARVAATIQQFDGFIARYVGDGVLIHFGWPEARETDAERAVRAGLAVAAAVSEAPLSSERLQVRVGIATGLVVIGEPIGSDDSRQQTAIGETPNRAACLQGLAGPGQVVIDAATRRQTGRLFECQDLGTIEHSKVWRWRCRRGKSCLKTARSASSRRCARVRPPSLVAMRRWSCCSAAGRRRRRATDGWC